MLKLMAISGSLRKTSYNSAALESIKVLAPAGVDIRIYDALANLPLFNPDHESDAGPEVEKLSMLLGRSDGLIIASPEYAHGISGALKNALDWLVGGEAFINIPVRNFEK